MTAIEMRIAKALTEFMAIAEADIREAHGEPVQRKSPSSRAMAVYPEAVRRAEIFADSSN
jgi:hypothetical protein